MCTTIKYKIVIILVLIVTTNESFINGINYRNLFTNDDNLDTSGELSILDETPKQDDDLINTNEMFTNYNGRDDTNLQYEKLKLYKMILTDFMKNYSKRQSKILPTCLSKLCSMGRKRTI